MWTWAGSVISLHMDLYRAQLHEDKEDEVSPLPRTEVCRIPGPGRAWHVGAALRARMGDGRRRVRVHVLSGDLAQHEAGDGKATKCGKVGSEENTAIQEWKVGNEEHKHNECWLITFTSSLRYTL